MKTIIGLIGVKTSGKSTVCNMLKSNISNASEVMLAGKLKKVCSDVFNIPLDYFNNQDLKEKNLDKFKKLTLLDIQDILERFNLYYTTRALDSSISVIGMELKTPRQIAQVVGTDILRPLAGKDIHCEHLEMDSETVIVSDIRFNNEYDYFMNKENSLFLPLYIARDIAENKVDENSHASEKEVSSMKTKSYIIDNNGSLSETADQVDLFIKNNLIK